MVEVPEVPHGCKAIADVARFRRRDHTFGRTRLRRNHQVVLSQIELLQGQRVQWKHVPMPLPASRQVLQEGRGQLMLLKLRRKHAAVSHERKEIRLRKQLAERLNDAFSSAPTHKPVVDKCYTHLTPKD